MKRTITNLMASTLVLALGACAVDGTIDPNSTWDATPVGSKLVLHRDIEVPADRARVFIQDGAVVSGFNPFKVHCAFEVDDVLLHPQVIRADAFSVRKVQREETQVVGLQPPRLAALAAVDMDSNDGPGDIIKLWHLWLSSAAQPNVRRLSCGGVRDRPYDARYPSINEIKAALGELATLELPPPPAGSPDSGPGN